MAKKRRDEGEANGHEPPIEPVPSRDHAQMMRIFDRLRKELDEAVRAESAAVDGGLISGAVIAQAVQNLMKVLILDIARSTQPNDPDMRISLYNEMRILFSNAMEDLIQEDAMKQKLKQFGNRIRLVGEE